MTEPKTKTKEITTPLALEMAEYVLLKLDIESALETFALWYEKYQYNPALTKEHNIISLSLLRDAVIMFIGCFDNTAQVSLSPEDVYSAADGSLRYFKWLKDIRDGYAAHKFGPLRQCAIGVNVDDSGSVLDSTYLRQIWAGPTPESRDNTLDVMRMAHRFVEAKVHSLGSQLHKYAKTLPSDQLATLKPYSVRPVGIDEIRISRAKFSSKSGP